MTVQVSVRTLGVTVGARSPLARRCRADHAPRVGVAVWIPAARLRLATVIPVVVEFVVAGLVDLAVP
jgi:hypothetical protein